MPSRPAFLLALGIGLLGYSIDQLTKWVAVEQLTQRQPVEVIGTLLRFTLIYNPGAAFGLGSNATLALSIFAIVALLACVTIGLPRVRTMPQGVVLGLLMAGIAGNLHDRLLRGDSPLFGKVVDFFQLPNFAVFNVADMCITSAAVLVVLMAFLDGRRERKAEAQRGLVQ